MKKNIVNHCPYCEEILVEDPKTISYYCPNPYCLRAKFQKVNEIMKETEEFDADFIREGLKIKRDELEKYLSDHYFLFWNYLFSAVLLYVIFKYLTYTIRLIKDDTWFVIIFGIILLVASIICGFILDMKIKAKRGIEDQITILNYKIEMKQK